jgi:asparagine synthetase A
MEYAKEVTDATATTQPYYMDIWNWERYFNAAKSVLETRQETKDNLTVIYSMETTPTMKELSQKLMEQLLVIANKAASLAPSIN